MKYLLKNISDKTKYIHEVERDEEHKKGDVFRVWKETFKVIEVL